MSVPTTAPDEADAALGPPPPLASAFGFDGAAPRPSDFRLDSGDDTSPTLGPRYGAGGRYFGYD